MPPILYSVFALIVFALGWKLWAWYSKCTVMSRIDKPLAFHNPKFHIAVFCLLLVLMGVSSFLFFLAEPWLAIAPIPFAAVLFHRQRKANSNAALRLIATIVATYAEALKEGKSEVEAKSIALKSVDDRDWIGEFSEDQKKISLDIHISSMLQMRGMIAGFEGADDFERYSAQMDDIKKTVDTLLVANGIPLKDRK
jgi:hypothetical protein